MGHDLRQHHAARRGASAIEFALLMPVFVFVLAGVLEYGWFFFVQSGASTAIRRACRSGALIPVDDVPGPEQRTEEVADEALSRYGIRCSGDGATCTVTTEIITNAAGTDLRCVIALENTSLTGLVPVPEQHRVVTELKLEQP